MNIICPKYVIKTPKQANRLCFSVFIVNFEQILHITVLFLDMFLPLKKQIRIQNPVKHPKWSFLQKQVTAFNHQLFLQKDPFSLSFKWASTDSTNINLTLKVRRARKTRWSLRFLGVILITYTKTFKACSSAKNLSKFL